MPARTGFDSTYEGLKRRQGRVCRRRSARFDSTYEGLKRELQRFIEYKALGFDSTYEGLKPLLAATVRRLSAVSTVPMRA